MNSREIRVGVVGIGNCASSFVQGLEFYRSVNENIGTVPGLMRNIVGPYKISDIRVVAAFDVDSRKIGLDVAEAIFTEPTNATQFTSVNNLGVEVSAGFVGDGIAPHLLPLFKLTEAPTGVAETLRESRCDICISFLPVGSDLATAFYAQACLDAKVAFINGIPSFIASDPAWVAKFEQAGLPVAGDDIQSQIGATIIHRSLVSLIRERGLVVEDSYQLDIGGNMDFNNLTDRQRLSSKKKSKTDAVILESGTENISVVPADYIPFLSDRKIAYINIRGKQFGNFPFEIELKLAVEDSPNNAGVMVDAVRLMKISRDRNLIGYQEWSSYFFKHPLRIISLERARRIVEAFLGD